MVQVVVADALGFALGYHIFDDFGDLAEESVNSLEDFEAGAVDGKFVACVTISFFIEGFVALLTVMMFLLF